MFKGFICEATGNRIDPQSCLDCARKGALPGCDMTTAVITGIMANLKPEGTNRELTITTLLGCARKARLKQETDYYLKPSEAWWAFRGQLFHAGLARYAEEADISEERFLMLVETSTGKLVEISGQPDLVIVDRANQRLLDYKTTNRLPADWKTYLCPETGEVIQESTVSIRTKWVTCPFCDEERHLTRSVEIKGPPRPRERDVLQLSLYRLLLFEHGIEIEHGEVVYMDMRGSLRVPVKLLPIEDAGKLLQERVALHIQSELPPPLSDPDLVWECDYCPVREACELRFGGN